MRHSSMVTDGTPRRNVFKSLARKMTIQASFIALAAILSIGLASIIIEQFLIREALKREAEHYWANIENDPSFQLANTANLKGYLSNGISHIPSELAEAELGYTKIHGQLKGSLLYVSEREEARLYLVFSGESVWRLAIYFGIIPLTIVLILIYIVAWWVYRQSSDMLSPIVWLANKFDRFDPAHPDSSIADLDQIPGDRDWEVETLVGSLSKYSKRIKQFVERERAFTRDASHEFRTPLTVIKMASDLLLAEDDLSDYSRKCGQRIKNSVHDMEGLIDAFLVLARETDEEFSDEHIVVAEIVNYEVDAAKVYNLEKRLEINVIESYPLQLTTARKVLSIVIGNLIRNAIIYTSQGNVTITILEDSVMISDTGQGMSEEQIQRIFQPYYRANSDHPRQRNGYGVGLTIVKRLSSRFDWDVSVESQLSKGTTFTVRF